MVHYLMPKGWLGPFSCSHGLCFIVEKAWNAAPSRLKLRLDGPCGVVANVFSDNADFVWASALHARLVRAGF